MKRFGKLFVICMVFISVFAMVTCTGCGSKKNSGYYDEADEEYDEDEEVEEETDTEELEEIEGKTEETGTEEHATEDSGATGEVSETPEDISSNIDDGLSAIEENAKEYRVELQWSYIAPVIEEKNDFPSAYVDVFSGESTINYQVQDMEETNGTKTYYYEINGEMVPAYSIYSNMTDPSTLAGTCTVTLYRDDVIYFMKWESGPYNFDTDCSVAVYENDVKIDKYSDCAFWTRAQTGIWYMAVGQLANGEYGQYDNDLLQGLLGN